MNIYEEIKRLVTNTDTVLDICCGIGNVSHSLDVKRLVGIDIYQKYLDKYKIRKPSVELICGDAISVCKQFENDTFDVVLLVDAVEHLTKPDALELLRESERICKRTIFVFTPESKSEINVNKPHDAWGISGGDEYQLHKCGFKREDFIKLGYDIKEGKSCINNYDSTTYKEMVYIKTIKKEI
jgi:2-polyprenyl-3-methyl-5-hydroxy-6-metoxy-1,4-benzoquinol methylase